MTFNQHTTGRRIGWILPGLLILLGYVLFIVMLMPATPNVPARVIEEQSSSAAEVVFSSAISSRSSANESVRSASTSAGIRVTRVVDGDTLHVSFDGKIEKLRIIGIDAPEMNPKECLADQAKARLAQMVTGKDLRLEAKTNEDRDVFGRILRYVHIGDIDIGLMMVREGFAISYEKYPHALLKVYETVERESMSTRSGMWGVCDFSSSNASTQSAAATMKPAAMPPPLSPASSSAAAGSCIIKGNIVADGDRIYHVPGCTYYRKTTINTLRGERWFCSEADARVAGWKKARNCP